MDQSKYLSNENHSIHEILRVIVMLQYSSVAQFHTITFLNFVIISNFSWISKFLLLCITALFGSPLVGIVYKSQWLNQRKEHRKILDATKLSWIFHWLPRFMWFPATPKTFKYYRRHSTIFIPSKKCCPTSVFYHFRKVWNTTPVNNAQDGLSFVGHFSVEK